MLVPLLVLFPAALTERWDGVDGLVPEDVGVGDTEGGWGEVDDDVNEGGWDGC